MSEGIDIPVGIRHANFRRGLDEMRSQAQKFKSSISGSLSFGGVAAGVTAAVAGAAVAFGSLIEKYAHLQDMADRYGESAVGIQKVTFAAEMSGTTLEDVAKIMGVLTAEATKALDPMSEQAGIFKRLGINAAEFRGMDMQTQLLELASAYERADKSGNGVVDVMELLGKKGRDLVPIISQGKKELEEMFKEAKTVSNGTVAAFARIDDSITKMRLNSRAWSVDLIGHVGAAAVSFQRLIPFMQQFDALHQNFKFIPTSAQLEKGIQKTFFDDGSAERTKAEEKAKKDKEAQKLADEADSKKKLRKDIAAMEEQARTQEKEGIEQLLELYRQRDEQLKKSNDSTIEGLEAKKKALEIDKEAKKLAEEITTKADEVGKKRAQLASQREAAREKQKEELKEAKRREAEVDQANQISAIKDPDKKANLLEKLQKLAFAGAAKLESQANTLATGWHASDADKSRADEMRINAAKARTYGKELTPEIADLRDQARDARERAAKEAAEKASDTLEKQKTRPSIIADSMRAVGGGGFAHLNAPVRNPQEETNNILKQIREELRNGGDKGGIAERVPAFASEHKRQTEPGLRGGGLRGGGLRTSHL